MRIFVGCRERLTEARLYSETIISEQRLDKDEATGRERSSCGRLFERLQQTPTVKKNAA
jgi:hypothetical protein